MSCVPEAPPLLLVGRVAAQVCLGQVKDQPSPADISGTKAQLVPNERPGPLPPRSKTSYALPESSFPPASLRESGTSMSAGLIAGVLTCAPTDNSTLQVSTESSGGRGVTAHTELPFEPLRPDHTETCGCINSTPVDLTPRKHVLDEMVKQCAFSGFSGPGVKVEDLGFAGEPRSGPTIALYWIGNTRGRISKA